jgi:hypothetical protein
MITESCRTFKNSIYKEGCLFVLFLIGEVGMHQLGFIMFGPMMKLLNIEQLFQ